MTTAVFFGTLLVATLCNSLNPIAHAESNNTEWHLTVTGLVQQPLNITLIDLFAMPQTGIYASLVCAGPPTYLVTEGNWTGVKLWLILQEAGILNGTVKVAFYAKDGYTTDLTLETAQHSDVLVA
jgi:DMSO/TMAO reductase YedYZ molybdopterin-dependent catalytic subunit